MKQILIACVVICACIITVEVSLLGVRMHKGMKFAAESVPFEARVTNANHRILIVGDSTGVGTGAERPQDSIAGRIFRDYQDVEIVNLARNGAKVEDVIGQLQSIVSERFDIVLVQAGGNDILRFTGLEELRRTIVGVLGAAKDIGTHVIFISTGNVGSAPAFFTPVNRIYTGRTRKVRHVFMEVAGRAGVEYVDLFKEKKDDPFWKEPERFYASDFLHPGSAGYGLWYEELNRQTSLPSILTARGAQ
jgi:lysophospholipase L1-like esterase